MYTINNITTYYIFDTLNQKYIFKGNKESLIKFLCRYQSHNDLKHYGKSFKYYGNQLLDEITFNVEYESFTSGHEIFIHRFLFLDNNNRIIDARIFFEEILDLINFREKTYSNHNNWCYNFFSKEYVRNKYRVIRGKGPVPYTGNSHYNCVRNVKRGRLVRETNSEEYKKYGRNKKYYLDWDYPFKNRSKSWKDNTKCRKQWQKHCH